MRPLRLTHYCLATCLGAGLAPTLAALRTTRSGLVPCTYEGVDFPNYVGTIGALDDLEFPGELAQFDCRNNRVALAALVQDDFLTAARNARARYGARRVGLFLGTSTSGIQEAERAYTERGPDGRLPSSFRYASTHNSFSLARYAQRVFGLEGPSVVISSACATTAKVFASAARMIEAGFCDAAIVGGADSLCLTTLYGFRALGLVSSEPCRPFDIARQGISIGEGAGFALLERGPVDDAAHDIWLWGVGESSDAYHMSTPHPEGLGAQLAMTRALRDAALEPGDIDYINLHGTATRTNDAAEDHAICALFGSDTPCSSTKGLTGHTLGAAGIVEAIVCALALEHGFVPGSAHTRAVDPELHCDYRLAARPAALARVLSNSFGFGGSNCSLVFGLAP